jgi:hypothetical protein
MYRGLNYALAVVDQHGEQWLVEKNIGNDMEVSVRAGAAILTLAQELQRSRDVSPVSAFRP